MLSLPVPPTNQSLPRSPKRTSSPSVARKAEARHEPFDAVWMHPNTSLPFAVPSVASKLRKYCRDVGAGPVFQTWNVSGSNMIARRGSNSSYRKNSPRRAALWWFEFHGFVSAPKCRMSPGLNGRVQSVRTRPFAQLTCWSQIGLYVCM